MVYASTSKFLGILPRGISLSATIHAPKSIEVIELDMNSLSGTVPESVAKCKALERMSLASNRPFSILPQRRTVKVAVSTTKKVDPKALALKAAKAVKSGASTLKKKAKKIRTSVTFHRPKTLKKARDPKYPRISATPRNKLDHYQILNYLKYPNQESKTILKERFRSFNIAFEEVYKSQTGWLILDPQLREDLRISVSLKVVQAYRTFLGRHASQLDSERHIERYIKYTADDLQNYLLDFFEGSQRSLHNSRRR
ncbi:hypothetical protein IFM89_021863 [Coptis chinensis]|uniref:Exocyst subunit Exo70 family protein n=1 Tax=Coptis chinensis TaxID=261450 RepID=A0A835HJ17_9MAGN|nr:hypothetical protein IFM89_021863 [Coptis chinensis]